MIRLGVNIDHVATVRQARRGREPDPVWAAVQAELGGADLITVHLREDRRHIQDRDLRLLKQTVGVPLNLELAAVEEIVRIACEVRPDQATLVPERREEITTEGGLDVVSHERVVAAAVKQLQAAGIRVALFIDPDLQQIEIAKALGVAAVEIQTARYSEASLTPQGESSSLGDRFTELAEAARHAQERGLHVHMGHGLNYQNVEPVAAIPQVEELNIGHSIVSRALFIGLERAVREMRDLMRAARRQ
jgi:pyridoxine 5-phosphate synthase